MYVAFVTYFRKGHLNIVHDTEFLDLKDKMLVSSLQQKLTRYLKEMLVLTFFV